MLGIKMPWTKRREAREAAEALELAERERCRDQLRAELRKRLARARAEKAERARAGTGRED